MPDESELKGVYNSVGTHLKATERHLPYEITQCYLPSDTGECTPP